MEVAACNVSRLKTDSTIIDNPLQVKLYPNPTTGRAEVASSRNITTDMIHVFDLQGRRVHYKSARLTPRKIEINLSGNSSGIYLVRIIEGRDQFSGKIILVSD
jgi:lysyl endopeptidase